MPRAARFSLISPISLDSSFASAHDFTGFASLKDGHRFASISPISGRRRAAIILFDIARIIIRVFVKNAAQDTFRIAAAICALPLKPPGTPSSAYRSGMELLYALAATPLTLSTC